MIQVAKNKIRKLLFSVPLFKSWILNGMIGDLQPTNPLALVLFVALPAAVPRANDKVSARRFLPAFCGSLSEHGFATAFVASERQLKRGVARHNTVFLVHLFGEDHDNISSSSIRALERKAAAVFNSSQTGNLLADKLATHELYAEHGIPVPPIATGAGFVRARAGTGRQTSIHDPTFENTIDPANEIKTEFIDTRVKFRNTLYYTSVRLLSLDGVVLHAFPRCRDVCEANPSVHNSDTPRDPELIEYLHSILISPHQKEFSDVSEAIYSCLGHGFYAHDILVDREAGSIFVCESGFKFDDMSYWSRFEPICRQLPSQSVLFPVESFAERSAKVFANSCLSLLKNP